MVTPRRPEWHPGNTNEHHGGRFPDIDRVPHQPSPNNINQVPGYNGGGGNSVIKWLFIAMLIVVLLVVVSICLSSRPSVSNEPIINSGTPRIYSSDSPPPTSPLPGPNSPRIGTVAASGSGMNLQITVTGLGFGQAPVRMPFSGNTGYFAFFNASRYWSAGYNGGPHPVTAVMLNYYKWSNTEIQINGFAGPYGKNGWINATGDRVGISFLNYLPNGSTIDRTWVIGNPP